MVRIMSVTGEWLLMERMDGERSSLTTGVTEIMPHVLVAGQSVMEQWPGDISLKIFILKQNMAQYRAAPLMIGL